VTEETRDSSDYASFSSRWVGAKKSFPAGRMCRLDFLKDPMEGRKGWWTDTRGEYLGKGSHQMSRSVAVAKQAVNGIKGSGTLSAGGCIAG